MNIKAYFQDICNKRRVHIAQLRVVREQADETARRKLDEKIAYEERQLEVITNTWSLT